MNQIRKLRADEVELRIGSTNKEKTKTQLLIFKNSRVDMAILDEVYGNLKWQDKYERIGDILFCSIGVLDTGTGQWVWKSSNGIESRGMGEDDPNNIKGEASDAFKRAGFMWGIGRELYEWKSIWADIPEKYIYTKNGRSAVKSSFTYNLEIKALEYTEKGKPKELLIVDKSSKEELYHFLDGKMITGKRKPKKTDKKDLSQNASNNTDKKEKDNSEGKSTLVEDINEHVSNRNKELYKKIYITVCNQLKENNFANEVIPEKAKNYINNYIGNNLNIPLNKIEFLEKLEDKLDNKKTSIVLGTFLEELKKEIDTDIAIQDISEEEII